MVYIPYSVRIKHMARPSQFKQAQSKIIDFFDDQDTAIFSPRDISNILFQGKRYWKLPEDYPVSKFTEQAIKHIDLKKQIITSPYRTYKRYIWKKASKYELFLTLAKNSYFTHQTALFLHQLITLEPNTIYLNFEQSKKPRPKGSLNQEGIDRAFENRQRMTKNIVTFNKDKIFLLNGKHTKMAGVIKLKNTYGELNVTSLERTLIDIVVRPDYTQDSKQILLAYKQAKDKVSLENILKTLKQLDYIYPYHQAIGFLLEKSGINDPKLLKPFKDLGLDFDFYLTRQMEDPEYSEEWRLYCPRELK